MRSPDARLGFVPRLERRLIDNDLLQVLVGYLAVLGFVLLTRWPTGSNADAAAWYPLVQARAALGALLGLAYGSAEIGRPARDRSATLLALVTLPLIALPLEAAAHASSYPAVPLLYSVLTAMAVPAAFYALGLGLGLVARRLRLGALLPLLVPALLALAFVADLRLGLTALNPITAATTVAPVHASLLGVGVVVALLATAVRRGADGAPAGRREDRT